MMSDFVDVEVEILASNSFLRSVQAGQIDWELFGKNLEAATHESNGIFGVDPKDGSGGRIAFENNVTGKKEYVRVGQKTFLMRIQQAKPTEIARM